MPTAAPARRRAETAREPKAGEGDADDLVSAPPPRPAAAPADRLRWVAAAALAALGLAAPWAVSNAGDAAALARAEARWAGTLAAGAPADRLAAARALGELGEDGRANFPALMGAVRGDDPAVRAAAAAALANFPGRRGEVHGRLTKVQREDDDPAVRAAAAATLAALDRPADAPAPAGGPPWWRWPLAAALLAGAGWVAVRG